MDVVARVGVRYVLEMEASGVDNLDGAFTFHVQKASDAEPWSEDDRIELGGRVFEWWTNAGPAEFNGAAAREHFPGFMRLDRIDVWSILPDPEGPTTLNPEGDDIHGSGGNLEVPQVAHLIGLRTLEDTRRGRGRIYFPAVQPPLGEGRAYGLVHEFTRLDLGRIAANLGIAIRRDTFETDPWFLSVFSRVAATAWAVTRFVVPDRAATQRRRVQKPSTYDHFGLDGVLDEPG